VEPRRNQHSCRHPLPAYLATRPTGSASMKRLDHLFDPTRRRADNEWAAAKERWTALSIQPSAVIELLEGATRLRLMWEEFWSVLPSSRATSRFYRRLARETERDFKHARPLLALLQGNPDRFGFLGVAVEVETRAYIAWLRMGGVPAPREAHHKPGERWLRPIVPKLFSMFRGTARNTAEAIRLVLECFVLEGHGDVVTAEMIRNIVAPRSHTRPAKNKSSIKARRATVLYERDD
jgi:hypothetical protein